MQLLQHGIATALRLKLRPSPNAKHASINLARDFLIIVLSNVARRPRQSLLPSPGTPTANAIARGLPRLLPRPMQARQTSVECATSRERPRLRRSFARAAARAQAVARAIECNGKRRGRRARRGKMVRAIADRATVTPAIDNRIARTRIAAGQPTDPFRGGHACVLDDGARCGRDD
ncbi:hypothetical protein ACLMLE_05225 [Lysobacter capsici]